MTNQSDITVTVTNAEDNKANKALQTLRDSVREIQVILDSGIFPEADLASLQGIQSLRNEFVSAMQRIMTFSPSGNNAEALPLVWSEPSNLSRTTGLHGTVGEALKSGIEDLTTFLKANYDQYIDDGKKSEALDQLETHLTEVETAYETLDTYAKSHPTAKHG